MTAPLPKRQHWLRRLFARVAERLAGALGVVIALVVIGLVLLVRNLDSAPVKRRLQALVRAQAGVELDYRETHLWPQSGFSISGVTVRSPPELQKFAPDLFRAGTVELGWSIKIADSAAPLRFSARDLEFTVVASDDGRTSLSLLAAAPAPTATPAAAPTPLSRLLPDLLARVMPVKRASIERLAVNWVRVECGKEVDRFRFEGVSAFAETGSDGGRPIVRIDLGTADAPLELRFSRERFGHVGEVVARLRAAVPVTGGAAGADVELRLVRQTLLPPLPKLDHLLSLKAEARFDPARGATRIELTKLDLSDGAGAISGALALDDREGQPPRLVHASGTLDAKRLVKLVPADLLPAQLGDGKISFTADDVLLAAAPRLGEHGKLDVEAHLDDVRAAGLSVERARLTVRGTPGKHGTTRFALEAALGPVRAAEGAARLAVDGLTFSADAQVPQNAPLAVDATLRFAKIQASAGAALTLDLGAGRLGVRAAELRLDARGPLAFKGALTVDGEVASAEAAAATLHAAADGLTWNLRSQLTGRAPYSLDGEIPIAHARVTGARNVVLLPSTPARLALRVGEFFPDLAHPLRSTATAHLDADLGSVKASASATKRADSAEFQLAADAGTLALCRPLTDANLPWDHMTVTLRTSGTIEHLLDAAPFLRQHTLITLGQPGFTRGHTALAASQLALTFDTAGTRRHQDATFDARVTALVMDEQKIGDGHLALTATADTAHPSVKIRFTGEGAAGPSGTLAIDASFDPARRGLHYIVDGKLAKLGPLDPFLSPVPVAGDFDLTALALELHDEGTLYGLIERIAADGTPSFAPRPLDSMHGDDASELRLANVDFYLEGPDVELESPALVLKNRAHAEPGAHRRASVDVSAQQATVAIGEHVVELKDLHDTIDARLDGDPLTGDAEVTHKLTVASGTQDFFAAYALGALAVTTHALRGADGSIRLQELVLDNAAGGTHLAASGVLDLAGDDGARAAGARMAGRRSVQLKGALTQKLVGLSGAPDRFSGRGTATLVARIDSGDLELFHSSATLKLAGAHVEVPKSGLVVDGVDGELPLTEDFVLDERGFSLVGAASANSYPQLRFADQHPFLSGHSYISAQKISLGALDVGPLAGNLHVEHNLVSLDQLELSALGGRMSGQALVDWRGADSTLQLRVRASHIEATRGGVEQPFDGNAAIVLSVRERTIEGRAEIIRIGRNHLYSLLDLFDPHHANVPANRVRTALALGYPDRARLLFDRGFASLLVTFGGLAKLVRVDEIRGIPTGPLIDRYLGPLIPSTEEP